MTGCAYWRAWLGCMLTGLAAVLLIACGETSPAIEVQDRTVQVRNQSGEAWSNVEVWLNDHYRVTAATLEAGGRLEIPLDTFVAAYGRRFDRRRQAPFGIEVTARTASGEDVTLSWGKGRRR